MQIPTEVQQLANVLMAIGLAIVGIANVIVHRQSKKKPSVAIDAPELIVYLEDNQADIERMQRSLHKAGVLNPLLIVTSAEEVLAILRELKPRPLILLSDARMTSDNYRLLDLLRGDTRTRAIPVVLVTTKAEDIEMYQRGILCHILKPITVGSMVECLGSHGFRWQMYADQARISDIGEVKNVSNKRQSI